MAISGGIGPDPNGAIVNCCGPTGFGVATIAAWPLRVQTEAPPSSSQSALDAALADGARMMAAAAAPARRAGAKILMAMIVILSVVGGEILTVSEGFDLFAPDDSIVGSARREVTTFIEKTYH
jgi:hypothetical protein